MRSRAIAFFFFKIGMSVFIPRAGTAASARRTSESSSDLEALAVAQALADLAADAPRTPPSDMGGLDEGGEPLPTPSQPPPPPTACLNAARGDPLQVSRVSHAPPQGIMLPSLVRAIEEAMEGSLGLQATLGVRTLGGWNL